MIGIKVGGKEDFLICKLFLISDQYQFEVKKLEIKCANIMLSFSHYRK
jgi:hypothetical protein